MRQSANTTAKPFILTTGEPAGVGPDLCIQLADYLCRQSVVLCGDIDLLVERAKQHGKNISFHHQGQPPPTTASIAVRHTPLAGSVQAGQLDAKNSAYVIETLRIAATETLLGNYAGIVTAPIHKGIICQAGGRHADFSGHTEFFAACCRADLPVMVLANEQLKVGLVTTHLPLHSVAEAVTSSRLEKIITIIDSDMRRYFTDARAPRIGVCGLNPHAGEGGHMGREEIEIIDPTLAKLRQGGVCVSTALPADTLFVPHHAEQYDIIVAMYHDQGLPVIKAQAFGSCVNLTFGLPVIRTSVDHGTALDLAGTDRANANSLRCAIEMAKRMAKLPNRLI